MKSLKVPVRCLSCKHEFIFEGYFLENIFCEKCKNLCEYFEGNIWKDRKIK